MDEDTVKLLRECEAGVRMGVSAIDEVLKNVESDGLRRVLTDSRQRNVSLGDRAYALLRQCGDSGKKPSVMAEVGSWIKLNANMAAEPGDERIITLMADGCGMGVKGLGKAVCEYPAASEEAKAIANELIDEQERLLSELQRSAK